MNNSDERDYTEEAANSLLMHEEDEEDTWVEVMLDDGFCPIRTNVLVPTHQHVQYYNGKTVPPGMILVESAHSGNTYLIRPDQII